MCSACGAAAVADLDIHWHRQPDNAVDAHLELCESCYWTVMDFVEAEGVRREVVPLRGFR